MKSGSWSMCRARLVPSLFQRTIFEARVFCPRLLPLAGLAGPEGWGAGGGVALLRAARALDKFKIFEPNEDGEVSGDLDEQIGVTIVKRALEEPLRQIVQNTVKEGAVIVEKVRAEKNANFGYNAETEEFEDLVAAGIIDPVKVTRCALQNAASIAGLMLTTETLISERQKDGQPEAMTGAMGGGMGF